MTKYITVKTKRTALLCVTRTVSAIICNLSQDRTNFVDQQNLSKKVQLLTDYQIQEL